MATPRHGALGLLRVTEKMPAGRDSRGTSWSGEENRLIVNDYFDMLSRELRGEAFAKTDHNARLRVTLSARSKGSVERKHQNISAILMQAGLPFIDGYKPLRNAQRSLASAVQEYLAEHPDTLRLFDDVAAAAPQWTSEAGVSAIGREVARPRWTPAERILDRAFSPLTLVPVDYAERDRKNRELGSRGEEFILDGELRRLTDAGRGDLASRVVHVSKSEGDGTGYDIRSFELSGDPRLIEVKTTNYNARHPFMISRREVAVSVHEAKRYRLFRVFSFSRDPHYFVLHGPVRQSCLLEPTNYLARVV